MSLSLAWLVEASAWSVFKGVPFMAFFVAVFVSAWIGGRFPGILATLLAALIVNLRFLQPIGVLSLRQDAFFATAGFVFSGILFSLLSESRMRSVAAAEQALRAREEFLAIAAHELRTPLTSLRLRIQLLRKQGVGEALVPLERIVRRMDRLVEQLLVEEHRQLQLDNVDVLEVARATVAGLEVENDRCPVSIQAGAPVVGRFDRDLLLRIASSLIGNALKYGAGKPVEVRVAQEDGKAVLEVVDQGIGIAAEDQLRIFHAFERAVPSRSFGGLGLGLYIARNAAQAHGGDIQVRSAPGRGAIFRVELPIR